MPGFQRRSRRAGRVVVTGAGGLVGGILCRRLGSIYDLHGIDVSAGPHVDEVVDMRNPDAVAAAFAGADLVVDLAADSDMHASWESVRTNNLPATINAFEASAHAGVRRIVFASSNHVVGMYEHDEPYASVVAGRYRDLDPSTLPRLGTNVAVRPDGPYGIGKAFGEATARYYAEERGLSAICLRIGTVNPADRPANARQFATLLTHRDLAQLVECCLDASDSYRFGIFYGVSRNTWRIWDIEEARSTIGYDPRDNAEHWR